MLVVESSDEDEAMGRTNIWTHQVTSDASLNCQPLENPCCIACFFFNEAALRGMKEIRTIGGTLGPQF